MKHLRPALLLTALAALLAGCDSEPDRVITYATWKQFPPMVYPQATATPVRLDLHFSPGSDALSQDDEVALSNFLAQNHIGNGGALDISVPLPQPGETRLVTSRINAVEKTLARRGVVVSSVFASPDGVPETLSILGHNAAVQLPPCPGYNVPTQLDSEKQGVVNFGCSNAANLDLMVANPSDVAQGRSLPPADAEASTLGIERYRQGKVIPPVSMDTSQ